MDEWPPVIALIITYRRLPLAIETIRSVKEQIGYPGQIGFHIADDGSGEDYVKRLREEIGSDYHVTSTDSARAGVGKNMNMGIQACLERADIWLHLEDDWVLPKHLDLRPCVQFLVEEERAGMVRLGRLTAGLVGKVVSGAHQLWWVLDRKSDTYVFSGNASLRHRRFHDAYGLYPESQSPGRTELFYCGKFQSMTGPEIVAPAWLSTHDVFQHIGDHQSFKWWMETGGKSAEEAAEMFEEMAKEAVS